MNTIEVWGVVFYILLGVAWTNMPDGPLRNGLFVAVLVLGLVLIIGHFIGRRAAN